MQASQAFSEMSREPLEFRGEALMADSLFTSYFLNEVLRNRRVETQRPDR